MYTYTYWYKYLDDISLRMNSAALFIFDHTGHERNHYPHLDHVFQESRVEIYYGLVRWFGLFQNSVSFIDLKPMTSKY